MPRIEIALCSRYDEKGETIRMDALDVPTALMITDINVTAGDAELWQNGRRLSRLTKHGGMHGTFWEVGSN